MEAQKWTLVSDGVLFSALGMSEESSGLVPFLRSGDPFLGPFLGPFPGSFLGSLFCGLC
jgi:hypothetical protein